MTPTDAENGAAESRFSASSTAVKHFTRVQPETAKSLERFDEFGLGQSSVEPDGKLAQRESDRFTRDRSQVRSLYFPPYLFEIPTKSARTSEPEERANATPGSNQAKHSGGVQVAAISPITIARFWSKVGVTPSNGQCWEWKGAVNGNGYGNFRMPEYGRMNFSAHRVAYAITHATWPDEGLVVRHKCDNPLCVNPNHLETGTHQDNMTDMVIRGRHVGRDQSGEANAAAKLTQANVERIRELIALRHTNTAIAKMFGVHHATISQIRRGRSWAA